MLCSRPWRQLVLVDRFFLIEVLRKQNRTDPIFAKHEPILGKTLLFLLVIWTALKGTATSFGAGTRNSSRAAFCGVPRRSPSEQIAQGPCVQPGDRSN